MTFARATKTRNEKGVKAVKKAVDKKQRKLVVFPTSLIKAIKKHAKKNACSESELIRRALYEYMDD